MLLSCLLFKNSTDQYNATIKENYGKGKDKDKDDKDYSKCLACIIIAVVILIIEVALLYFALDIAVNTTQSGAERFVHVLLAVLFTMPYLLFSVLLSSKAQQVLRGNFSSVTSSFKMACGMGSSKPKLGCGMTPSKAKFAFHRRRSAGRR